MQLETAAEGGATNGTERLRSGMMSEIKGGGVLDHEDGCVLSAALESPLSMGLKDRGRSDGRGAPEAVGSFGSSPRTGSLGHTGSRMGTQLGNEGGQTTSEAAIAELCSLKFMNSPVR